MAAGVMTTGIQGVVALPIVLPLLGAAAGVVFGAWRQVQRAITLVTLVSVLGVSIALLIEADSTGYVVQSAGGWAAPLGIVLVVDRC